MNDIIRIGIVSTISPNNRTVRVRFPSDDMVSGWLKVIKSPPAVNATAMATADTTVNGNDEGANVKDSNISVDVNVDVDVKTEVSPWMPVVGETVLCVYNSGFNEDGFVIGGM